MQNWKSCLKVNGMARGKKSAQPVLRKGLGNAAPAAQFDPKASRAKKLETAEDAFGGDEDDCESFQRAKCRQETDTIHSSPRQPRSGPFRVRSC